MHIPAICKMHRPKKAKKTQNIKQRYKILVFMMHTWVLWTGLWEYFSHKKIGSSGIRFYDWCTMTNPLCLTRGGSTSNVYSFLLTSLLVSQDGEDLQNRCSSVINDKLNTEKLRESLCQPQTPQTQESTRFPALTNWVWLHFKADNELWDEPWDNDSSDMKRFLLNERRLFQNNSLSDCVACTTFCLVCGLKVACVRSSESVSIFD